jgi:MFS family permease
MPMRWIILFVLFFARTVMAFQFQSVAALSPLIIDSLAITLTDIGLLIGLYLGPGVVVAIGGGAVATRFGDKRTVVASLALMVAGGVLVAQATTLETAIAGRLVSGIGGVVINVLMTKLVVDWFAKGGLSTALAVFISSWPLGIALSLLVLPALADRGGLDLAWNALTVLTVAALLTFALIYRKPPGAAEGGARIAVTALPWGPLVWASLLWGLYNAAFAMLFGFGPLVLIERGFTTAAAASATSLYILTATLAIPLGGWLADRTGRGTLVVLVSLVAGVVLYPALLHLPIPLVPAALAVGGAVVGLAPGPVVAMPGRILPPEARAFGTGVFYAIFYLQMMIVPPLAGAIADRVGDVGVAFILGSAMMAAAVVALAAFVRTATPPRAVGA